MSGSLFTAMPRCTVEIYSNIASNPAFFSFSGAQIVSATTAKDISDPNSGTFQITLPPGGPNGPNLLPTWAQVFKPMSLVLIGMQRLTNSDIVMAGLVTQIDEVEVWQADRVVRQTVVQGTDFSYFFTTFNYFTLGFLGQTAGSVIGESIGLGPAASITYLQSGYLSGTPQQIGTNFFTGVMFGTNGLLQNVNIVYGNGQKMKLGSTIGYSFAEYTDAYIQFDSDYVTTEGNWMGKFENIFPSPWYEFFVTTAPGGSYGPQTGGYEFLMRTLQTAPGSGPMAVARVNPTPVLTVSGTTITGVNSTAWNALTIYTPIEMSPRQTALSFGIGETANYFAANPTMFGTLFGSSNSLINSYLFTANSALDVTSINEYGYRPAILPTLWIGDSTGQNAQNANTDFSQLAPTLAARIVSTYGPLAIMASTTVTMPLRPDILPGFRFRFTPEKAGQTWDFYIQGVQHNYDFGGDSTTVLTLTRGLPTAVYESPALLQAALSGKLVRDASQPSYYAVDNTRTGVQFFGPSSNIQALLGQISSGFTATGTN
jgi:hypothetical protein